jgi:gluconate 2-dehydrogenase gamma chain
MPEHAPDNPRRDFLRKTLTLIPSLPWPAQGWAWAPASCLRPRNRISNRAGHATAGDYQPTFFSAEEWAFASCRVAHHPGR